MRDQTNTMAGVVADGARRSPTARVTRNYASRGACSSPITPSPMVLVEVPKVVPSTLTPPRGPWHDPAAASLEGGGLARLPLGATILSQAALILPTQAQQRRVDGGKAGDKRRTSKALLLLSAIVLASLALSAAPALAAPVLGITMEHHNAYGAQADSCPGGHESLAGEPDCGVDPYTGSGTTFDRESGFNAYTINVTNTASRVGATETVTCNPGYWEDEPTFSYEWLRNGMAIAGATGETYETTVADEGKALQCLVTGTNEGGATVVTSSVVLVPPTAATTSPEARNGFPLVEDEEAELAEREPEVGDTLACNPNPGAWEGEPTFSYVWLRNGAVIAGATGETYVATVADEGKALQCLVTGTNEGGATSSVSRHSIVLAPVPSTASPAGEEATAAASTSGSTSGPVKVTDTLPAGLVLAGEFESDEASGSGWTCTIANPSSVTCTRSDALAPGESYPPVTLHVHVNPEAPLGAPPRGGVTNIATVSGGGSSPATASTSDPTTIAEVPFGINSFTTSVINATGDPFTQAAGHPFSANTTFVFNYVPDDLGGLKTAGGSSEGHRDGTSSWLRRKPAGGVQVSRGNLRNVWRNALPAGHSRGLHRLQLQPRSDRSRSGATLRWLRTRPYLQSGRLDGTRSRVRFRRRCDLRSLYSKCSRTKRRRLRHHNQQPVYRDSLSSGREPHVLREWCRPGWWSRGTDFVMRGT